MGRWGDGGEVRRGWGWNKGKEVFLGGGLLVLFFLKRGIGVYREGGVEIGGGFGFFRFIFEFFCG